MLRVKRTKNYTSSCRVKRAPHLILTLFSSPCIGAKFAFDIYDFEGKSRMDLFYLGDCLRGLNLNPTLKMIDKLGGTKKKGEKYLKLEEVESERVCGGNIDIDIEQ